MSDSTQAFKLLLTYDIRPEHSQAYFRFMLGRYVPAMAELGLEMSDAWHTAYGNHPHRLIGFVAEDEETMRKLLNAEIWAALNQELQHFVTDFRYRVTHYRHGFQY